MKKYSAHKNKWVLSKWLLFAIFSLQTVLLSGWTSQDAIPVDSATYTEWVIDQRFHFENTTVSLWENNQHQKNNHNSSFVAFQALPLLLSLNVVIAVKINHAQTVIYQFPSPIYFLQQYIYINSLEYSMI